MMKPGVTDDIRAKNAAFRETTPPAVFVPIHIVVCEVSIHIDNLADSADAGDPVGMLKHAKLATEAINRASTMTTELMASR